MAEGASQQVSITGARFHITGVVQGVGFRPFVYGLAVRLGLTGWVRNTSAGVDIEADGSPEALAEFGRALRAETPPLARIDNFQFQPAALQNFTTFEIAHSESLPEAFQPIAPDVSICPDCLRELFDPRDRRYRYAFINCTNCGPRFTLITDIPYDRLNTTMAGFPLCPDCAAEYADPASRRFHAQPVACPVCGPFVWLEEIEISHPKSKNPKIQPSGDKALRASRRLLRKGKILAVKGLGGFHLACDATNAQAVAELRRRKLRVDKPFAVMMPDMAAVEQHCVVSEAERALLESRERPIVILRRRPGSTIVAEVTPCQDTLGVMLPYTPLHYLLLEREPASPAALVMTSGNLSEEPIATDNAEARERLTPLTDAFLMHNRDIRMRCDDSVIRLLPSLKFSHRNTDTKSTAYSLRRSRGYAPFPIRLPWEAPPVLAAGAELKNVFCVTREHYAFLSHYVGDMENYETLRSFEDGVSHFERLFRIRPEALAYDLHPDYLATRYALERAEREKLPAIGVQHHHAHVAACMAEHGLSGDKPVIGVSFDGTGYGDDEAIWGGEFLLADYRGYRRVCHLSYVPLPGGDLAVHEPWRLALAWLGHAGVAWDIDLPPVQYADRHNQTSVPVLNIVRHQLQTGVNAPLTSSMGRLFDAASSLMGVRHLVNYEAQAAIELEARVDPDETAIYSFDFTSNQPSQSFASGQYSSTEIGIIDPAAAVRAITIDIRSGVPTPQIAARFHNTMATMTHVVCQKIRHISGVSEVVLSGGVWQNMVLLEHTLRLLQKDNFHVYTHQRVPTNDGGISLGQASIAIASLRGKG